MNGEGPRLSAKEMGLTPEEARALGLEEEETPVTTEPEDYTADEAERNRRSKLGQEIFKKPTLAEIPIGGRIQDDVGGLWMKVKNSEAPDIPDDEKRNGLFVAITPEGNQIYQKTIKGSTDWKNRKGSWQPAFRTYFSNGRWEPVDSGTKESNE